MARLSCGRCGTALEHAAFACPACGFPPSRSRTLHGAAPNPSSSNDAPPVTTERLAETPGERPEPCDHNGNPEGAVICLTCGQAVRAQATGPASDDRSAAHAILSLPWGEHAMAPGDVVDIGREVGPFEQALQAYPTVGRRHGTLRLTERGTLLLRDHSSTNGTFINGQRCGATGETEVAHGSEVRFGGALRVVVRFERC